MLVPLILVMFWKTRIHLWRVVGIVLAFLGLFLMTVPAGRAGLADFANVNRGDILSIGCAFGFALQIVFLGRATQRFPFEQIAVLQIGTAAALMAITVPLLEHPRFQLSNAVIATVLITGILGTAVAFTVQAWAQQFTPATHTALIFNMEPVFAWLTSFLYLNERLGLRAGAGALLILTGVLVSELLGQVSQLDSKTAGGGVSASSRRITPAWVFASKPLHSRTPTDAACPCRSVRFIILETSSGGRLSMNSRFAALVARIRTQRMLSTLAILLDTDGWHSYWNGAEPQWRKREFFDAFRCHPAAAHADAAATQQYIRPGGQDD